MMEKQLNLNDGRRIMIRQLEQDDKERLVNFYGDLSEETARRVKIPENQELFQKFRFPDYFINVVTEHEENIVGYGEIMKDPEKENGELEIYIHQDFQGVGLGTAIMIIMLKEATEEGLRRIHLDVSADNRVAIHLFRKFGFQQEKSIRETDPSGDVSETLHMVRTLNR
jgi:ribosomal protein S18 acetylase RimI-like enzyme